MGVVKVRRFDIILMSLDPTQGAEIQKTRPCVVISPDEMNDFIRTIIIAPMTTTLRAYPTRVYIKFNGREGEIALDQIRVIDKSRVVKSLGKLEKHTSSQVRDVLIEMFS